MNAALESGAVAVETGRSSEVNKRGYLFLSSWPVKTGSGVNGVIFGLSAAMRANYRPEIVVTGWEQPTVPDQQWMKLRSPGLSLQTRFAFLLHLLPDLVRAHRSTRGAGVVNPHYFGLETLPLAILKKVGRIEKLILSAHGADVTYALHSSWLEKKLYAWICRSADAVVACSGWLAGRVSQLSPGAKVVPVWNGVSRPPQDFGPRPLASPYLLSVAAFVPKKGHDVLLHAFRRISAAFPDLKLVLIGGEGPERASVEELARALGLEDRVQLVFNLDHDRVWDWIHHAECFVHSPREEPFGIAVLEAGLARTPVVTTAVGGIPEYLVNGVHGLTCEPDNPEEFAAAVIAVLNDQAGARLRAQAFYERASTFTWEAAWQQYRFAAGLALSAEEASAAACE